MKYQTHETGQVPTTPTTTEPRRSRTTASKLSCEEMQEWLRKCAAVGAKPGVVIREWINAWDPFAEDD